MQVCLHLHVCLHQPPANCSVSADVSRYIFKVWKMITKVCGVLLQQPLGVAHSHPTGQPCVCVCVSQLSTHSLYFTMCSCLCRAGVWKLSPSVKIPDFPKLQDIVEVASEYTGTQAAAVGGLLLGTILQGAKSAHEVMAQTAGSDPCLSQAIQRMTAADMQMAAGLQLRDNLTRPGVPVHGEGHDGLCYGCLVDGRGTSTVYYARAHAFGIRKLRNPVLS